MQIRKTFKNIDLIEITEDSYCVRRRYKSLFGKWKHDYFCLDRNGTNFTHDGLFSPVTVGNVGRADYVFRCNAIVLGAI